MCVGHATGGSAMIAVLMLCACGCSAQARPCGQEGDTVKTVYPTVGPGATPGVAYQRGIVGLALSLERTGACVRRQRTGALDPEAGSVEMWLSPKMPVDEMQDFSAIFSMVAEPFMQNIPNSMLLFVANSGTDSHGQIVFGINLAPGRMESLVATPRLTWEVGSWHHISAGWGPQGMALYVDGRQTVANQATSGPKRPGDMIGIGGHASAGAWSQPCEFLIDELRISGTERSVEEVAASIARGQAGQPLEEDEATLLLEHFDGTPAPPMRITSEWPAHIMPAGAKALARVLIPAVTEGRLALSWEATDLEGAPAGSGEVTASVEDTGGPTTDASAQLALDSLPPGAYNLRVSANADGQPGASGAATVWVGASPAEPLMEYESPFGQSSCFARDLTEEVFAAQRQMGVKWSRVPFVWSEIEPVNDRFEWDKYDEIVRLADKYGVELVPTFMWEDPIPAWAGTQRVEVGGGMDNKRNLPPERLEDWRDYVAHVVERYRDSVDWWIPWNEPNLTKYLGPEQSAAKYIELLRECAVTIREVDPDARICGMSLALVDLPFYEECFELGALEYCDAVGCHPYRMGVDPDERSVGLNRMIGLTEERTWLEELQELRALIDKYAGGRRLGIWLDEMGQPTEEDFVIPNVAVTEQTAAIYLARMYAEGIGTQVIDRGLWFAFYGYGSFSLLRDDFTLKPEAIAYCLLASALAGKRGVPGQARSGDVHAYRFEGDGAGAWVTWSKGSAQEVVLSGVPDGARAYDIFGRPVRVTIAGGRARLAPGVTPTIIEW